MITISSGASVIGHFQLVQAWCERRVQLTDLRHSLRSEILRPKCVPASSFWEAQESNPFLFRQAVVEIGNARLSQIARESSPVVKSIGRILVSSPREAIGDGFAEEDTNGFFDRFNVPPWDTWICCVDEMILSYVPIDVVHCVECAFLSIAEESICWGDKIDNKEVAEVMWTIRQGGNDSR